MPKAKRVKGRRLTRQAPFNPFKPRPKWKGRPKGTYKRYSFEQTRLGFFLKYECPALYEVLLRLALHGEFAEPKIQLIEIVCRNSNDSSLKKPKFERYLEEYRKKGVYCTRPKQMTPQRESYYKRIRGKKAKEYLLTECKNQGGNYCYGKKK